MNRYDMSQAWTKGEAYGIQIMEKQWRFQLKESWVTDRGPSLFRSQNPDCIANEHLLEKTFTIKKAVWFSSLILGCICLHCGKQRLPAYRIKSWFTAKRRFLCRHQERQSSAESGPNKTMLQKHWLTLGSCPGTAARKNMCIYIYTSCVAHGFYSLQIGALEVYHLVEKLSQGQSKTEKAMLLYNATIRLRGRNKGLQFACVHNKDHQNPNNGYKNTKSSQ